MDFKEILNRKIKYYGKTEAAYEFAAEEYANKLIKEAQTEQLRIGDVVGKSEQLISFQNFLILDGQLDIDSDEVKRNAETFLGD